MYRFTLDESSTKYSVYINLIASPAGHYLSRRPYVIGLIREVLPAMRLRGQRLVIEHDMGRNIGTSDIVKTSNDDSIYYAQPIKSAVFSRFAKNRSPQPSQLLTIVMVQDADGDYEIQNAWIGPSSPAFPGDEHETPGSRAYWQTHALVQDAQVIQLKSITKDCPY